MKFMLLESCKSRFDYIILNQICTAISEHLFCKAFSQIFLINTITLKFVSAILHHLLNLIHHFTNAVMKYQICPAFHLRFAFIDNHKILPMIHMRKLRCTPHLQ